MLKNYLLNGVAWAFIGKLVTAGTGLLIVALLARVLSPAEMGAYFLALNLATFFSIIARAGMENTLLRFIAESVELNDYNRAKEIIKRGFTLLLASCLFVLLVLIGGGGRWMGLQLFNSETLASAVVPLSIWSVLLAFQFVVGETFRGFQDIKAAVIFGGAMSAALTALVLTAYAGGGEALSLSDVLFLICGALIINLSFSFNYLSKKLRRSVACTGNKKALPGYIDLIQHSWPLFISAVTLFLLSQSDLWLLGAFASDQDVAVYGAAARLVLLTGMTLAMANAVVPPLIARMHVAQNMVKLEQLLRSVATIAAIPSISVLAIFIFFGDWVLNFVYGDYYRAGGLVLAILSIGQAVNVTVGSCGYLLIMTGHRRTLMWISVFSLLVALGFGMLLVDQYGAVGLAVAYSGASVFQQVGMLVFGRLRCGVWTHASFNLRAMFLQLRRIAL